jgi:hypothetical protein
MSVCSERQETAVAGHSVHRDILRLPLSPCLCLFVRARCALSCASLRPTRTHTTSLSHAHRPRANGLTMTQCKVGVQDLHRAVEKGMSGIRARTRGPRRTNQGQGDAVELGFAA